MYKQIHIGLFRIRWTWPFKFSLDRLICPYDGQRSSDLLVELAKSNKRAHEIGFAEMNRRRYLYDEAQLLCSKLVWHPKRRSNPGRLTPLLERAEMRRERRAEYCWGKRG